jgi:type II secretory pathway component GspD/PulD (secretin)
MPLIEALIKELDQLPSAESQIKIFRIANGDATTLMNVLQTMYQPTTSTAGGGLGGVGGSTSQIATVRPGVDEGDSTLVSVRFAVDTRTNSIIAIGSAGEMSAIEAILLNLDEENATNRKVMVFKLVNKPADRLAPVLQQYINNERTLENQNSGMYYPQSPAEQYRKEVVVVAEPLSNSLIVSSTPQYCEQIRKIVQQLDERPLMVQIQVLIAEVTLKNNREFGVELGLQDSLLFDRSLLSDGALTPGFLFGDPGQGLPLGNVGSRKVGSQGITSLGVGRTGSSGIGGFTFSASSESLSVLLRALEVESKMRVLSRPQITALDNLPAIIQVGQDIPYVTGTNLGTGGTTSNTTDYHEVGVILHVTPRITPDNMIMMDL